MVIHILLLYFSNGDVLFADFEMIFPNENDKSRVVDLVNEDKGVIDLTTGEAKSSSLNFLTYNLWFREDIALLSRMLSIKDIILNSDVHICCFQEVTKTILQILRENLPTYNFVPQKQYEILPYFTCICYASQNTSLSIRLSAKQWYPFANSIMHRGLQIFNFEIKRFVTSKIHKIIVATTHLESPLGFRQRLLKERQQQLNESFRKLEEESKNGNICFFMGDMNWIDNKDYPLNVNKNWVDVWKLKNTSKEPGYTYDQKTNDMIPGRRYRSRLDRVLVKNLVHTKLVDTSIVGNQQIGSLTYTAKNQKTGVEQELPVFPSDHYGLLIKKSF